MPDEFGLNLQMLYELLRAERKHGAEIARQPSLDDGDRSRAQVDLRLFRPERRLSGARHVVTGRVEAENGVNTLRSDAWERTEPAMALRGLLKLD